MSKIYNIKTKKHKHGGHIGFSNSVKFQLATVEDDDWEELRDELGQWLSYTFRYNFVLLELSSRIIAGGCVDNKQGWDEGWRDWENREAADDNGPFPTGNYELRCHDADLTLFLLKYGNK